MGLEIEGRKLDHTVCEMCLRKVQKVSRCHGFPAMATWLEFLDVGHTHPLEAQTLNNILFSPFQTSHVWFHEIRNLPKGFRCLFKRYLFCTYEI